MYATNPCVRFSITQVSTAPSSSSRLLIPVQVKEPSLRRVRGENVLVCGWSVLLDVLLKLRSLGCECLHLRLHLLLDVVDWFPGGLLDALVMGDVFLHESPHQPSALDITGCESHGVIVVCNLLLSVLHPDSVMGLIAYLNILHFLGNVGGVDLEARWHFRLQHVETLEDVLESSLYFDDLSVQGIETGSSAHDGARDLATCTLLDVASISYVETHTVCNCLLKVGHTSRCR